MGLSETSKERLGMIFEVAKTVFHWGFIPGVLYLGKYHDSSFSRRKFSFSLIFLDLRLFQRS